MSPTPDSLKILTILPFFYPHRGGSQKYAEDLYATMVKNNPSVVVDVLTYNTDSTATYEEYRRLHIHRIPCWQIIAARFALPNPFFLLKKLIELSRNHYDVVNTHVRFFDPTWWGWFYARCIGAKSVFTGHVASHPQHQNTWVRLVAKLVDSSLGRLAINRYDLITVENESAGKFMMKSMGIRGYTVIQAGIDTAVFVPKPKLNRVIPKLGTSVPDDVILVSYVGRLIWTKGVTYLLDAVKPILRQHPNTLFILGGPGELQAELEQRIKEEELSDFVYLLGDLTYQQVQDILRMTDVFVYPSHHNEGMPITILEAAASGCAIVATDNGDVTELIQHATTGWIIPRQDSSAIAEAIGHLITQPDLRQNLSENVLHSVREKHDLSRQSNRLFSLFVRLVASSK